MIRLEIEHNEKTLTNYFKAKTFDNRVTYRTLPTSEMNVGDIIISYIDGTSNHSIVLERKTCSDLANSVMTGRWQDQSQRLKSAALTCDHVCVILEGPSFNWQLKKKPFTNMSPKSYLSSVTCILFRENFKLIYCKTSDDTIAFIELLIERILERPQNYFRKSTGPIVYEPNTIKTKKIDNIDPETSFLMQLSCIPYISTKKAKLIIQHLNVNNMQSLIAILGKNADPHGLLCTVPKIGNSAAQTILQYIGIDKSK